MEYYVFQGIDLSCFDEEIDMVIILFEDDILDFDVVVEDNILIYIFMQIFFEVE